jgi:hypothetical protein
MDAIIVIVFLKYSRTRVAENPVSFSFGEMTCQKVDWLAIRCERYEESEWWISEE